MLAAGIFYTLLPFFPFYIFYFAFVWLVHLHVLAIPGYLYKGKHPNQTHIGRSSTALPIPSPSSYFCGGFRGACDSLCCVIQPKNTRAVHLSSCMQRAGDTLLFYLNMVFFHGDYEARRFRMYTYMPLPFVNRFWVFIHTNWSTKIEKKEQSNMSQLCSVQSREGKFL